ncbi:4-hydroxy-tetrahydrodipicolinate synthase [Desulfovermiculus halophilus]|jgi:4-hydroxy-tetrahydrodipicolinate synthase|uniref:4-hydroxy-tetrahydrodipicolinate synthase n=1 Tax=Desulfovermiculus halophilus TaxID=339722 RepID=UPI00048A1FC4|nr:4-hydroxy-tetrahydrodipicolinate synthase [Desulfovermiculus halophilus]
MQFQGALTALVTPFHNNEIDEERFRAHIEDQIVRGIHGLVPCGTTGESATMTHEEHKQAIKICVDQAKGRVPVLAGAGSNNTREAIELTTFAKQAGADGTLHITPYYNKPTQAGVVAHFQAIAREVPMPMIVYNVPGRTGLNVLPETLAKLHATVPEVVGVKEASGNINQMSQVIEHCGPDFTVLAGDDFVVLPLLSLGGKGVISVLSNLLPDKMASLCEAYAHADLEKAKGLHYELAPLCRAMFLETNPIPVKTSLALMGRLELSLRLPLVPMQPENEAKLREDLSRAGLL